MRQCEWSTNKNVKTVIPTKDQIRIPNNQNGKARWKTLPELILSYKKSEEEDQWEIIEKETDLEIQFGENMLFKLEKAIRGVPQGIGDFAISNNSEGGILNFWWNLEKE
jgi:hypothetical protein